MAKTPAEEAVTLGAALLDKGRPGWAGDIDLHQLDIMSPCRCVLGQTFSGERFPYSVGLDVLGIRGSGSSYGFDQSTGKGKAVTYDQLQAAWVALIGERRA